MAIFDDDLVRDILLRVMATSESFSEDQAQQIEQQIRHDWGGERVVVAKKMHKAEDRKKVVARVVQHKIPPGIVARQSGIGRATLYRWLKKK